MTAAVTRGERQSEAKFRRRFAMALRSYPNHRRRAVYGQLMIRMIIWGNASDEYLAEVICREPDYEIRRNHLNLARDRNRVEAMVNAWWDGFREERVKWNH